jgi:hypothetical protein
LISEYFTKLGSLASEGKLASFETGFRCMRKRFDDFFIQVLVLISYQIAGASSILSHFRQHFFVAAISNSKRVDTDVVLLSVAS